MGEEDSRHPVYRLQGGNKGPVVQVFEGKVVADQADSKNMKQLSTLRTQLERARKNGLPNGHAIGVVYMVQIASRHTDRSGMGVFPLPSDFYDHARVLIENVFAKTNPTFEPNSGVREVFRLHPATWEGWQPKVSLALLLVAL